MSSGGHTMTEGWNLQLQGRVRDLETDLAMAEQRLEDLTNNMRSPAYWQLARGFLEKMAAKRQQTAERDKDLAAFLEQEGVDAALGEPKASEHPSSERRGLEEAAINYVQSVRSYGNLGEPWQDLCDAVDRALIPPS